jgi:hypothetical protein
MLPENKSAVIDGGGGAMSGTVAYVTWGEVVD